jgi:hypothetical protein
MGRVFEAEECRLSPRLAKREAMAVASVSPLLTMFRVPRPVHTIRLRSRGQIDMEREL